MWKDISSIGDQDNMVDFVMYKEVVSLMKGE